MPVSNAIPNKMSKPNRFPEIFTDNSFAARLLNTGSRSFTIINEKTSAINASRIDSPKNCFIISVLCAPATFLIPTSLARFPERAVARFIKLIHAMNKIKNATKEKIVDVGH